MVVLVTFHVAPRWYLHECGCIHVNAVSVAAYMPGLPVEMVAGDSVRMEAHTIVTSDKTYLCGMFGIC